jgi:hypothetical protein
LAINQSVECTRCGISIIGGKLMMKLHMKRHSTKQAD